MTVTVTVPPPTPTVKLRIQRNTDATYSAVVTYTFFSGGSLSLSLLPSGKQLGSTYLDLSGLGNSGEITQSLGTFDTDRTIEAVATGCGGVVATADATVTGCDKCKGPKTEAGGPVRLFDGVMTYSETDPLPMTIGSEFRREYSSGAAADGRFGLGWSSVFDASAVPTDATAQAVSIVNEDRSHDTFRRGADGQWTQSWPAGGAAGTFSGSEATGYTFRDAGGTLVRTFDTNHRLVRLQDLRRGRAVSITYDGSGSPTRIFDEAGNWSATVTTANGHVVQISIDGRSDLVWTYVYSGSLLTSVSVAGAPSPWRTYQYTNNRITAISDATGTVFERHDYDTLGRATSSYDASGDITNIAYPATDASGISTATVTRADNSQATYQLAFSNGGVVTQHVDGGCSTCGSQDATAAYDAFGNLSRIQNARGYITESTYDGSGRQLIRTETAEVPQGCNPATDPGHCRLNADALATATLNGTTASQTTTYTYGDANWPGRPTRTTHDGVEAPGVTLTETFSLDPSTGETLVHTITGAVDAGGTLESHTTTTSLYGSSEVAAFAPGGAFQPAWLSLAQPPGLTKSIDGPRTAVSDVTTFVYYPFDTTVPGPWRGHLAAVRNALGHVSRYEDYNVFGRAATLTDANGSYTGFTFDSMGRLVTSIIAGTPGCNTSADPLCATNLTTSRTYSSLTGPVASEQRPAGNLTSYMYDTRGRILTVTTGTSTTGLERITYTYDPTTGKKSTETISAFQNNTWVVTKNETYTYSSDGQLSGVIHADNTSIHYAYLPDGTLASIQDENHTSPNTTYSYDPANRPTSLTQNLAVGEIVTSYTYDVAGNVASTTDPNGNTTTFSYDDFGRMQRQQSPVSGTTTYTYDVAGNNLTTTDANGAVTSRVYDALSRVTSSTATRDNTSETVTWTYDDQTAGNFGFGRMTAMSDPAGTTAYQYERRGLLRSEVKAINGATYTTTYTYDANGNRNAVTYPSGLTAQYTFDFADRPYSLIAGSATIVSAASYLPFGPLATMSLGNGTTRTMQYDTRYRPLENKLTGPSGMIADYTYAEDAAGNITQLHDATDARYNRDFAYDDVNRLTTANSGTQLWGNGTYAYDRMGNMLSSALGTWKTTSASLVGTTPKLSSVTENGLVRSVAYDSAGNETGVGPSNYSYSPRNELLVADAASFVYDGRGVATIGSAPSMTISVPQSIKGGSSGTGSVSLGTAPVTDTTITLASDNAAASVSGTVVIPAGTTSASFTITTTPVPASVQASITASLFGASQSAALIVLPPQIVSISVSPSSAYAGDPVTATVTLDSPAVTTTAVSVVGSLVGSPNSVSITAGAASASLTIIPYRLFQATPTQVIVSGLLDQIAVHTTLLVNPPVVSALNVTPSTITGGTSTTAQVTVTGTSEFMPMSGMTIPVTSSNFAAAGVLSGAIGFPSSTTSGSGTVATAPVLASTSVLLTATTGSISQSASVTLQPVPVTIASIAVSPTSLVGSNSATGTITLTAAAPAAGIDVDVSTNNAAVVPGPAFVHIGSGISSATFALNTKPVTASTAVTITANHSATMKTASLTVSAPSGNYVDSIYTPTATPVPNGVATHGGTAVASGVFLHTVAASNTKVTLSSSNTAIATVPSSVTVSRNLQNADFTITTFSVTTAASATISATFGGVVKKLVVTVLPANAVTIASISLSSNPLPGGYTVSGTIGLTGPAPAGGAVVTLAGTRANIINVDPSMTMPANATSGSFTYSSSTFLGSSHFADLSATYMGITQSVRVTIQPVTLTSGMQRMPSVQCASLSLAPCLAVARLRGLTAGSDPSRYYLYTPELQLMAETEQSTSTVKQIAYTYLWFGGQPAAQIENATSITRWYANDHLGTPYLQTDSTGAVVWRAEYTPYGDVFAYRAGATLHQPLRLPGQSTTDGNSLHYNIFRWYRSSFGRYSQADPIGLKAGANLYAYVKGNPTGYIDSLGLECSCPDCPRGVWLSGGVEAGFQAGFGGLGLNLSVFRCTSSAKKCTYFTVCGKFGNGLQVTLPAVAAGSVTLFAKCSSELGGWSFGWDLASSAPPTKPGLGGGLGFTIGDSATLSLNGVGGPMVGAASAFAICKATKISCN
jgi:RHS repeat-associated protein